MGLDMYLWRMPRYKDATAPDVVAIEEYLSWRESIASGACGKTMSMEEWCGISESDLPDEDVVNFYAPHYQTRYWIWDVDHRYPNSMIREEVAYWRKANQIHRWFVDHVQDGEDDCGFHDEVTKEDLLILKNICQYVLQSFDTLPGVAAAVLPTQPGFFFGTYDYDDFYKQDLVDTISQIETIIAETDFETQMIYYRSSW